MNKNDLDNHDRHRNLSVHPEREKHCQGSIALENINGLEMTQTNFNTAQEMADMLAEHMEIERTTPALVLWELQPGYSPRLEYTVQEYTEALCEVAKIDSQGRSPAEAMYAVAYKVSLDRSREFMAQELEAKNAN